MMQPGMYMEHVAYCWRSGEIGFAAASETLPDGVIVFATCPDRDRLEEKVSAGARHGYDGQTIFVPNLAEADDDDALAVLNRWRDWSFPDFPKVAGGGATMPDLLIAADGEVKLDYDAVGRIAWASSIAHLWVAGEWKAAGGDCGCDCCSENVVDPDAYDDLEEERDELENERDELAADLKRARDEIARLKRKVHALRYHPETVPVDGILPCPFCGGAMEDRGYGAVHIDPKKCPIGDLAVDLVRWNSRTVPPGALAPEVTEAKTDA